MKKITINNEVYLLEKDVQIELKKKNIKPTKKQIVILQRGWIVVGDYHEKNGDCTLTNAYVIRNWGTSKGLGELAECGALQNTKLDKTPDVHFSKINVIGRIDVNENNWK